MRKKCLGVREREKLKVSVRERKKCMGVGEGEKLNVSVRERGRMCVCERE